jgi:hypothetical protein
MTSANQAEQGRPRLSPGRQNCAVLRAGYTRRPVPDCPRLSGSDANPALFTLIITLH